jgi:hypothetical protein
MLAASAQSYSVIILVLLQPLGMQVIAGSAARRMIDNDFFRDVGKSILFD